jgi:hypothetical protein
MHRDAEPAGLVSRSGVGSPRKYASIRLWLGITIVWDPPSAAADFLFGFRSGGSGAASETIRKASARICGASTFSTPAAGLRHVGTSPLDAACQSSVKVFDDLIRFGPDQAGLIGGSYGALFIRVLQ